MIDFLNSPAGQTLVLIVFVPLFSAITTFVSKYLNAKAKEIISHTKNEQLLLHFNQAVDAVTAAVDATFQTYVDALKREGRFDAEAQKIAFNQAKDMALQTMSTETQQVLVSVIPDLAAWIEAKIEQSIKKNKPTAALPSDLVIADQ
ncbi:MAG: hypothetical protein BGN88_01865 [Clostridiales bacterium 43-6]|nr:MAG: hypothetical protein BGN88_01865 [Clostridiales bacterium 43-6]